MNKAIVKQLDEYITQKNFWRALKKQPLFDRATLTPSQARYLLDCVELDLEPENLTCDGELPTIEVNRRKAFLCTVREALEYGEY
jgi:hypothetical protein